MSVDSEVHERIGRPLGGCGRVLASIAFVVAGAALGIAVWREAGMWTAFSFWAMLTMWSIQAASINDLTTAMAETRIVAEHAFRYRKK